MDEAHTPRKKTTADKTTAAAPDAPAKKRGRPPKNPAASPLTPRDVPAEWTPSEAVPTAAPRPLPPVRTFRKPEPPRETAREAFTPPNMATQEEKKIVTPQEAREEARKAASEAVREAHGTDVERVAVAPHETAPERRDERSYEQRSPYGRPYEQRDRGERGERPQGDWYGGGGGGGGHRPHRGGPRPFRPHHQHSDKGGGGDFRQNSRFEMRRLSRRERIMLKRQDDPYQPQQDAAAGVPSDGPSVSIATFQAMEMAQLREQAETLGMSAEIAHLRKSEVVFELLRAHATRGGVVMAEGILEMLPDGVGFLRSACNQYRSSPEDACVLPPIIRRYGLRAGDAVSGMTRAPRDPKDRYFTLVNVDKLGGAAPTPNRETPHFEALAAEYPATPMPLETASEELATRMVDLVAPQGFGQRTLVVTPPGTESLRLLRTMADGILANHANAEAMIVMACNTPEDIAEMAASTKATVLGVSLDELPDQNVQVAEIAMEMARRKAESGKDVVILLDSLTSLADAYFALQPSVARNVHGLDSGVWLKVRRIFGAARAIVGGGSLTLIATFVPDETSAFHQQLLTRLRGMCTSEIVLDTALAAQAFPAINIEASRTVREERLLKPDTLVRTQVLRRALAGLAPAEALDMILKKMRASASNAEFLLSLKNNV
ncbi:MAG: transcription termination factor Rho [Kiritimatiellaeota bacterium]|nr:transcription termination factor Rho [Kiritimatiellota bacterium]